MTARLVRGSSILYLDQGRYSLGLDFIPPSIDRDFNLASGSAANILGGADLVGYKAKNRQWTFSVRVLSTKTVDIERGARDITSFLAQAGDPTNPTYLEWKEDSNPIPLWGQFGAPVRYEIVNGKAELGPEYGDGSIRSRLNNLKVTLEVKPVGVGFPQRLAMAMGGILEDNWGAVDGVSRGLIIPAGITNKMINPVFGASSWNTGWSASANTIASKNTDPRFLLPGQSVSARCFCKAAGNNAYYQNINAGNTNAHSFSALVMKPDLSPVTSADCQIFYNVPQTSAYVPIGNGLYLVKSENIAGINALTSTGILIQPNKTVFLLAYQMEEFAAASPVCWGDLLGCAWTGTAHASTSTRTVGSVKIPISADTLNLTAGAIRLVWIPDCANTFLENFIFFDTRDGGHANSLYAMFNATGDTFDFTDGTTTISSPAQTFTPGDKLVLDFVWGPSGLAIYKNGTLANSTASFTYPSAGTYLYLGSYFNPGNTLRGTLAGLSVFENEISCSQVAADYALLSPLVARGQRVETVPWLWTKDGDNQLDQVCDATNNNWAVVGGIPGNLKAAAEYRIYAYSGYTFWLGGSSFDYGQFIDPLMQSFLDESGTVLADTLGGQAKSSPVTEPVAVTVPAALVNRPVHFFARIQKNAATSFQVQGAISYNNTLYPGPATPTITRTPFAGFCMFYVGSVEYQQINLTGIGSSLYLGLYFPGVYSIYLDFLQAVIGSMAAISWVGTYLQLNDNFAVSLDVNLKPTQPVTMTGELPSLLPEKLNMLTAIVGNDQGTWGITALTPVTTFSFINVTPRWALV